jgi:hypothetical protein
MDSSWICNGFMMVVGEIAVRVLCWDNLLYQKKRNTNKHTNVIRATQSLQNWTWGGWMVILMHRSIWHCGTSTAQIITSGRISMIIRDPCLMRPFQQGISHLCGRNSMITEGPWIITPIQLYKSTCHIGSMCHMGIALWWLVARWQKQCAK